MPVLDELLVVSMLSVVMPWHASAGTAAGAAGDAQGAGKRAGSHCQAGPAVAADLGHADIQQAFACAAKEAAGAFGGAQRGAGHPGPHR